MAFPLYCRAYAKEVIVQFRVCPDQCPYRRFEFLDIGFQVSRHLCRRCRVVSGLVAGGLCHSGRIGIVARVSPSAGLSRAGEREKCKQHDARRVSCGCLHDGRVLFRRFPHLFFHDNSDNRDNVYLWLTRLMLSLLFCHLVTTETTTNLLKVVIVVSVVVRKYYLTITFRVVPSLMRTMFMPFCIVARRCPPAEKRAVGVAAASVSTPSMAVVPSLMVISFTIVPLG